MRLQAYTIRAFAILVASHVLGESHGAELPTISGSVSLRSPRLKKKRKKYSHTHIHCGGSVVYRPHFLAHPGVGPVAVGPVIERSPESCKLEYCESVRRDLRRWLIAINPRSLSRKKRQIEHLRQRRGRKLTFGKVYLILERSTGLEILTDDKLRQDKMRARLKFNPLDIACEEFQYNAECMTTTKAIAKKSIYK